MTSRAYVIDFGTSNSGIGALSATGDFEIARAKRPMEDQGDSSIYTEPSWVYIDDSGQKLAGWDALYTYQRMLDQSRTLERAQLVSGLKSDLGSVTMHDTTFFARWDLNLSLEDMISIVLKHLRATAERQFGDTPGSVKSVLMAHPVVFVGSRTDARGTISGAQHEGIEKLKAAANLAGFSDVEYYDEASASARSAKSTSGNILSVDFGGGTLDIAACVKPASGASEIISVKGAPIGGNDIDKNVFEILFYDFFGLNPDEDQDRPLPSRHRLIRNLYEFLKVLRDPDAVPNASYCAQVDGNENLFSYIQHMRNYRGVDLYRNMMATKAKLENTSQDVISYSMNPAFPPSKFEFKQEDLLNAFKQYTPAIKRTIDAVLKEANWSEKDVDHVILSGGSSRLLAFRNLMTEMFPGASIELGNSFTNVLEGLGERAKEIERWI